jgi:hypothetical protein
METGQSLLFGLNLAEAGSKELVWLITPTGSIQPQNGVNSFCALTTGLPELDQASFYVDRTLKDLFRDQ